MVIGNLYFWVLKIQIFIQSIYLAEIIAQLRHVGPRPEKG